MRTETGRATAVQHHRSRLRAVGRFGLALHLLLLGWLVLRPLPVAWVYDANLTPLASLRFSSAGQLLGELLLPAPLGVLLPLAGGRLGTPWLPSFLRTTGASALLATGLEFLSSWAPGHVLNVDHILLAVVGVAATHLALVPVGRVLLLRREAGSLGPVDHVSQPDPDLVPAPVPGSAPTAAAKRPRAAAVPAAHGGRKAEPLLSLGSPGPARRG
ncbi:VanZ family protein [Kitasatospora purpeofusca]|uniref:VanZ family protein n=1 Tax=Kitasatospora purpeofusca TaxID=67352 RepID=UPI00225138C8|nr:VanZ family protein [Kitasatospora purpeofusca]MCX4685921.1 VanZ family protein [Kitasatospora purpeofusca]